MKKIVIAVFDDQGNEEFKTVVEEVSDAFNALKPGEYAEEQVLEELRRDEA